MASEVRIRMTAAEFFELPETNQPTELIEGELIVSPTPTPRHQRVNGHTFLLLDDLIPDGEILHAPIGLYLDDDNVLQPDIIWAAENSRCVIGEKRLEGPPDLIVEIFSPSTSRRDKREKYQLYERYGVREYWMIDPDGQYVEVYRLEEGRFVQQGVYGPEDTFESAVLGDKTVDVSKIFLG